MWVENFIKLFFKKMYEILNHDGIALLTYHRLCQSKIGRQPQPWITQYIFPGGYTPSLSEMTNPY